MATYFGRFVTPSDNGSLSAETVTITPPGSMVKGDLVLMLGSCRTNSGTDWRLSNEGGQQWDDVGGTLQGFGCSTQRWWCEFNGTWVNNLLTANQASLETDTTGWAVNLNCTIARTSAGGALDGTFALEMTSVAAGNMSANTPTGLSGIPVTSGVLMKAMAHFKAAVTSRTVRTRIRFYDGAGVLTSSFSTSGTDNTSGFTKVEQVATVPTGAAFATIEVAVETPAAGGEVHYVDGISFAGHGGAAGQDFYLPSSVNPIIDSNFGSALEIQGAMFVFRPSASALGWAFETQNSSFLSSEANGDLIYPAQTITRYQTVAFLEMHRDILHTMAIQSAGWLNPSSETQWRNTAGSDILLSAMYQIYNTLGTTGDIINRANPTVSFQGSTYMSFYEVAPPTPRIIKPRARQRASRW